MRRLMFCVLTLGLAFGAVHQARAEKDPIVGRYDWATTGGVVAIYENGTAKSGDSQAGKWVVNPYVANGYLIMRDGGFTEIVKREGRKLKGTGVDPDGKSYEVGGVKKE